LEQVIMLSKAEIIQQGQALEALSSRSYHPVIVYLSTKTKASKSSLAGALRLAFGTVGLDYMELSTWQALDYSTLGALQNKLMQRNIVPLTVKHAMYAVRGVLRVAYRLGIISRDRLESALAVELVKSSSNVLAGREIHVQEASRLVQVLESDTSRASVRDRAILALLWGAGLRRAEIAALELGSLELGSARLIVHGKGRKIREVYLSSSALEALKAWLVVRGQEQGALFGAVSKSGRVSLKHMSAQAVYNVVAKRQEQAELERCTPHDFRRSYASNLLAAGIDIATVAELLGHASVNTTAKYDRRSSERKRRASTMIPSPF
jgi:site-specific recombinase XerC